METMRRVFIVLSNDKAKLFIKVVIAHVITYVVVGNIALLLLDYGDYIEVIGFRPMDEIRFSIVLLGQIVRGILFGIVILWIKDSIIGKKLAWFKLWAILVIVGIISTYEPTRFSIEGFIYLEPVDLPRNLWLSIIEILAQPLLFSIVVTYQRKKRMKSNRCNEK